MTNHEVDDLGDRMRVAFRQHPAGIALVTAHDEQGPLGMVVSSLASTSIDPPMVSFSVANSSYTGQRIANSDGVVIHLVTADDLRLAIDFSTPGTPRFTDEHPWQPAANGAPLLQTTGSQLTGRVVRQVPAGQSTLLLVELDEVDLPEELSAPVVWVSRAWRELR